MRQLHWGLPLREPGSQVPGEEAGTLSREMEEPVVLSWRPVKALKMQSEGHTENHNTCPPQILRFGSAQPLPWTREAWRPREGHSLAEEPLPSLEILSCCIWPPTSPTPTALAPAALVSYFPSSAVEIWVSIMVTRPGARACGRKNTRPTAWQSPSPTAGSFPHSCLGFRAVGTMPPAPA